MLHRGIADGSSDGIASATNLPHAKIVRYLASFTATTGPLLISRDTSEDLRAFLLALGFPRVIGALMQRLRGIAQAIIGKIPEMNGSTRKRIGDAVAEQARWIASAVGAEIANLERDLIVMNRP